METATAAVIVTDQLFQAFKVTAEKHPFLWAFAAGLGVAIDCVAFFGLH